jgi:high-affinity iron transporter
MRRIGLLCLLSAALGLAACAPASPRDAVNVAVRIEKVRAHLLAAREDAAAGRWDLAATHAAHPAEDLQPIDSALSKRDARADATLRGQLIAVRDAANAHDAAISDAVNAADRTLETAARTIAGDAAATEAFRAAVASELLELSTTEYSEAVSGGKLVAESEYQDAYAFLIRARILVPAIDGDLAAALPTVTAPATLIDAARYESLVDAEKDALADVSGAAYGTRTDDTTALIGALDATSAAIERGDAAAAADAITSFRGEWTQVEAFVKARSADAYEHVENDMASAAAALASRPADLARARDAVTDMRTELYPIVASPASYGIADAAIILLREGLEALLIIAALLAFLTKTGNASKRGWIVAGGGAGVGASIAIAVVITIAFSASEAAGADRELLEGFTGLFAAAMLVYMSLWLHAKSNLAGWQRYINEKSDAALARNSLVGLSAIAFLAVFREGAETALFYVGIAPSIATFDLVAGVAIGAVALGVIGVAVLRFGVRIPIRAFFLGTSVLVFYLALKFLGSGVHALQVAGIVPATPRTYLPDISLIGAFPTVETTVVQALLLGAALAWMAMRPARRRFDTVAGDATRMGSGTSARRG